MALQRADVLANWQHYFVTADGKAMKPEDAPPFQMMEDGASVSALAFMAYYPDIAKHEGRSFYGGKILKVLDVDNVKVQTHLDDPKEVKAGSLRFISWETNTEGPEGIFIVAARGTSGDANWNINFQLKPKDIDFEPYNPVATKDDTNGISTAGNSKQPATDLQHQQRKKLQAVSGIWETIHGRLKEILPIFDGYDPLKHHRVIITGHSLGSGIAQVLGMMLLNERNKQIIAQNPQTNQLIVDRTFDKPLLLSSLEVISFGGPACMNKELTEAGIKAFKAYNSKVMEARRPLDKYMVTIYTNYKDPVSFTGEKGAEYVESHWINNHIWQMPRKPSAGWSPTHLFFKWQTGMKWTSVPRQMAKMGVDFLRGTKHFGTQVMIQNSKYGTGLGKWATLGGLKAAVHGEYFDFVPFPGQLKVWLYD